VRMKRTAFAGGGVVIRMLNRLLSMAWESWQSTAADTKHLEAALRRKLDRGSVDIAVDSHVNSYVDISRGLCLLAVLAVLVKLWVALPSIE
jgi:hypothetical protein